MPPLRERGTDILLLADYFASQTARRYGLKETSFTDEARQALVSYDWPGNVREMKYLLERVVLLNA